MPLIAGSIPVAATVVGLPAAVAMFTVGCTFQFVGHAFEQKKPSFVDDKRQLLTGLLWWTQKVGLPLVEETAPKDVRTPADAAARSAEEAQRA